VTCVRAVVTLIWSTWISFVFVVIRGQSSPQRGVIFLLTRDDLVQVLTELRSLGPEDIADHLILHWPSIVGSDDAKHVKTMQSLSEGD